MIISNTTIRILLGALADPSSCYVLGAGASYPLVPLTSQIPNLVKQAFSRLAGAFPISICCDSPLYKLVHPPHSFDAYTLEDWKWLHSTPATIAVLLEQFITPSLESCPPQYWVFRLFPPTASIVSFNWDRLAGYFCPQRVINPHGRTAARRRLSEQELREFISWTQDISDTSGKGWLTALLILPGEEEGSHMSKTREIIFEKWRTCSSLISIGYSLDLTPWGYDKVWQEIFLEAMKENPASIHIISPDAVELVGELSDKLHRSVNVFSWAVRWNLLSRALILAANRSGIYCLETAMGRPDTIITEYKRLEQIQQIQEQIQGT